MKKQSGASEGSTVEKVNKIHKQNIISVVVTNVFFIFHAHSL